MVSKALCNGEGNCISVQEPGEWSVNEMEELCGPLWQPNTGLGSNRSEANPHREKKETFLSCLFDNAGRVDVNLCSSARKPPCGRTL